MGKTLMNKLSLPRKALAAGALVGAFALTGCEALFGSLLSATAPYSKDPRAGQAAYTLGQGMQSNQNARDGRSTVNVNVGNQNNGYRQPKNEPDLLLFTHLDENNNEVNAGKQIFYSGETIMIRGAVRFSDAKVLSNETTYITGNAEYPPNTKCEPVIKKNVIPGTYKIVNFTAKHFVEHIGEGLYENVWFMDGREVGRIRFSVYKASP
jgi:hypothetical protein